MTVTATPLHDVLDQPLLGDGVAGIRPPQRHPSLPLAVYNYTETAQYADVWNAVTLACRGLIVDAGTGAVAGPAVPKFFNHGQPGAPELDLAEPVDVTDKADGSLGILYPSADGWAVATRGSFASDQARHATAVLRHRYAGVHAAAGLTVLVEIIYPANRIVLDYGGLDDLVLLGAVDIATGRSHGPAAVPAGPARSSSGSRTRASPRRWPRRPRPTGRAWSSTSRLPTTGEDQVRGVRPAAPHRHRPQRPGGLGAPGRRRHARRALEPLPDEFHAWVARGRAGADAPRSRRGRGRVEAAYAAIVAALPEGWGRKEFALAVARTRERAACSCAWTARTTGPLLWQRARPDGRPADTRNAPTMTD